MLVFVVWTLVVWILTFLGEGGGQHVPRCGGAAWKGGKFSHKNLKFSHTHTWNQFAGRLGVGLKRARDQHFVTTTYGSRQVDLYVVENVYNTRDLKIKPQDCTISVKQQGAEFVITEGFDVIFSLLQEYEVWHEAAR